MDHRAHAEKLLDFLLLLTNKNGSQWGFQVHSNEFSCIATIALTMIEHQTSSNCNNIFCKEELILCRT